MTQWTLLMVYNYVTVPRIRSGTTPPIPDRGTVQYRQPPGYLPGPTPSYLRGPPHCTTGEGRMGHYSHSPKDTSWDNPAHTWARHCAPIQAAPRIPPGTNPFIPERAAALYYWSGTYGTLLTQSPGYLLGQPRPYLGEALCTNTGSPQDTSQDQPLHT